MLRILSTIAIGALLTLAFSNCTASAQSGSKTKGGVNIAQAGDKVKVEINGELFTEYYTKDVERPFFYPVIGPTGDSVVRRFPVEEPGPDEAKDKKDHPHHHGMWFTHGEVMNKKISDEMMDFWSAGKGVKIVHDKIVEMSSGPEKGVLKTQSKWVSGDGKVACTDTRTHTFYATPGAKIVDWEIVIHASNGEVLFADTKEGSMGIRLAATMRLKGAVGKGHIVTSEGVRDGATWGKKAAWVDYYGPVNGKTVGVAIFDHPSNPRHPTWWHVRDYGLFAANPFGVHYFEKKEKGAGNMLIKDGENATFRYRFLIHEGDEKQGNVAEEYKKYAK